MIENNAVRLVIFIAVLFIMMGLEALYPRRSRNIIRKKRWLTNLSLVFVNAVSLKLLGPVSALLVADYALENGWGVLAHSPVVLPFYIEVILGVILLDFAVYIQHVASHKVPILWRFHKVHHVDRDIV